MKKLISLIKACMTSDMNLFKISSKKDNKKSSIALPLFIGLYLMFMIWSLSNSMFEKLTPMNLQFLLLSILAFGISVMTIIEGVYKVGPLLYNCKDDQLLLSLPIKRSTVLFVRIFKFYLFELLFNSLFLLPVMIAYLRWANDLSWTYYLTSIIMLLFLPVIPIVISCIIGSITSSLSSRFKYKNIAQIVVSMIVLMGIMLLSFNLNNILNYIISNATSINDVITKIYYPAGIYASLVTNFNLGDLLIFILVNITLFVVTIFILSRFYFTLNSRVKKITTSKKTKIKNIIIKKNSINASLIKKEFNMFFQTPVFVINAGFALVLFIIISIVLTIKFDDILPLLTDPNGMNLSLDLINNNTSIFIFLIIMVTAFMTSITNSLISLEGRNINILKSLPINPKKILMSKIYSCLIITTPILFIGSIILFIKFKLSIIEAILLLILSILVPLVSHFIGLIINLKYPKLDAENSAEVVKQSTSSFLSVMIGMVLLMINVVVIINIIGKINSLLLLFILIAIYSFINIILYLRLTKKGVKEFNELTI